MQPPPPADLYTEVKDKYEGTQFRVEHPINLYYFWMNTTRAAVRRPRGAPGGQLRDRQRRAGTDLRRLARRHPPDPARGDARATSRSTSTRTTWPKPNSCSMKPTPPTATSRSGPTTKAPTTKPAPTTRTCSSELGFDAKLKTINADNYITIDRQRLDARPRHRLDQLVPGLPQPEQLLPAAAVRRKHRPDQQHESLAISTIRS